MRGGEGGTGGVYGSHVRPVTRLWYCPQVRYRVPQSRSQAARVFRTAGGALGVCGVVPQGMYCWVGGASGSATRHSSAL